MFCDLPVGAQQESAQMWPAVQLAERDHVRVCSNQEVPRALKGLAKKQTRIWRQRTLPEKTPRVVGLLSDISVAE